ncbi:ribosomal protein S18 acetylase RimI-like enzyme [Nonlabens dokdonensis]|jgi:GNAT superfamily N-acetyltransferase|uniref:Acetyltransferase n=2 Tax=Nonlabens dokdonensis TaxID=328515 RepID=L7WAN9_NONDD|nr:GNAT family N-acetyltransferase [Nonlabens dokdonensis]AGC76926.1 acetyltransferase [Nonlabens dokdonensis DSW-6]PZX36832.1 ribosomal protein S18 acetylase RimI-like enzyme [Nonlabens dokdonensis]
MIEVREVVKEDFPRVLELIKELAVFENEPEAVEVTIEELEENGLGDEALFKCFVGLYHNKIEGISLCYPRFSTWKGKTIHLEDLIVTEKMRGKGLGKALYDQVLQYAYEQNVRRVEWVVLDWNTNAIDFYEKTGVTMIKDWYLAQMDQTSLENYIKSK